jgi:hypothetical protein
MQLINLWVILQFLTEGLNDIVFVFNGFNWNIKIEKK